MQKDKSPGLPPPSGRFSGFSSFINASNNFNPMIETGSLGQTSENSLFSHDISKMPDNPPKELGHRRAQSEILTLPGGIGFNSNIGIVGAADGSSYLDEADDDLVSMYLDMDKFNSSFATSLFEVGDLSYAAAQGGVRAESDMLVGENVSSGVGSSVKPSIRHQHSQSLDGSTSFRPELLMSGSEEVPPAGSKKAVSAAKLAELARIDPKRAKKIWANRQSAARSKERKIRYMSELERKILKLQTEATSLSAHLNLLQRDTNGWTAEYSELKLRLQTMEQQLHLQDALNDELKDELQHTMMLAIQSMPNGGPMMNFASFGGNQQYYPNDNTMHTLLAAQQFQQLQIQPQKHQQHQFAPNQLHHQLHQQHQTGEPGARGPILSPNQKDSSSDVKSTA